MPMPRPRVAINGLGRIGRATLKVILSAGQFELAAVNDLVSPSNLAYLLRYDSVYGRYSKQVRSQGDQLIVGGAPIAVFDRPRPAELPWESLNIDLVFECTGRFLKEEELAGHLEAGARRVILSAPAKSEAISTAIAGVGGSPGSDRPRIVSCASCTTNCIAPVVEVLDRRIGVAKAILTTVHAYTASQALVDRGDKRFRRGRAAGSNFVPTTTGAASAAAKLLPQLKNKFDGIAIRGPVTAGSLADVVCLTKRDTTVEEVNRIFRDEAGSDRYQGILGVTDDPIVSSDVIADSRASIVDLEMTRVVDGNLVKVLSWYDNEWGYASQLVRHAMTILSNDGAR